MRFVIAPQLSSIPLDRYDVDELESAVDDLARLFEGCPSTVFLVGGLGLAVTNRRYYRNHRDIDVAIFIEDVERFIEHLDRVGYDFRVRRRSFRLYPKKRVFILERFDRTRVRTAIKQGRRFRAFRRTRNGVVVQRRRTDYFDVLFYERAPGGVRLVERDVVVPIDDFEPVRAVRDGSALSVCSPGYRRYIRPSSEKQFDDYVEYGIVSSPLPTEPPAAASRARSASPESRGARDEADQLWLLLAYASVAADWQHDADPAKRGHNIGSLLVDADGRLVGSALNSICVGDDASRHGEVLLMEERITRIPGRYLGGHTLYTTLEPCAMCAGMMTMLRVDRVVYGQPDPEFGGTLTRLRRWGRSGRPYPIRVEATGARDPVSRRLDVGYRSGRQQIITYLYTDEARRAMGEARRLLRDHVLEFEANRSTLHEVLGHLERTTSPASVAVTDGRR